MRLRALVLLVLAALPALAQSPERFSEDTLVVPAPLQEVWNAFVGEASSIPPSPHPGSRIVTTRALPSGELETTTRRVLALEPPSMLAFRLEPSPQAPESLTRHADACWNVLRLRELAFDRTEVSVATIAQGDGPESGAALQQFAASAREWVGEVQASFVPESAQASVTQAWELLRSWRGSWSCADHANEPGFDPRAAWITLEPILGGAFLLEEVWVGPPRELALSKRSIYGLDPRSRTLMVWSFGVGGWQREQTLSLEGGSLALRATRGSARSPSCYTTVTPEGDDARVEKVETDWDNSSEPIWSSRFVRAESLPDGWRLVDWQPDGVPQIAPPDYGPHMRTVGAAQERLWRALLSDATSAALWGVDAVTVDLRQGGTLELRGGTVSESVRTHRILALDPGRMLALSPLPPAGLAESPRAELARTCQVLQLDELGPERTRVSLNSFGDVPSDEARGLLARSTIEAGALLERLAQSFPLADTTAPLARLAGLASGEFEASAVVPPGTAIRASTRWSRWHEPFLVWEGRLGPQEAAELPEHTLMVYGLDPELGAAFWKFGADGSVARGALVLDGERGVAHDWHSHSPSGQVRDIWVQLVPDDEGYLYRAQPSRDEVTTIVELRYARR